MRVSIGVRSYSAGFTGPKTDDRKPKCVGSDHRYSSDTIHHENSDEPPCKNLDNGNPHHPMIKVIYCYIDAKHFDNAHSPPGKEIKGSLENSPYDNL